MAMARRIPVISFRLAPQAQHELERAVSVLKMDERVNQVDVIGSELQVTPHRSTAASFLLDGATGGGQHPPRTASPRIR